MTDNVLPFRTKTPPKPLPASTLKGDAAALERFVAGRIEEMLLDARKIKAVLGITVALGALYHICERLEEDSYRFERLDGITDRLVDRLRSYVCPQDRITISTSSTEISPPAALENTRPAPPSKTNSEDSWTLTEQEPPNV